jgi:glycerophosphoryl diester phosphodiesterase
MKKTLKDSIKELKKEKGLLILGHRGCRNSDVPENTLAAFQKAFEVGSDGIEIDVESTSDDKLVVTNRWFLKKNFDFFPWECDLYYLQSQGKQKGILIPTFDEVCELIKGKPDSIFNVEIKSSNIGSCRTAKKATKQIYNFGIENQVLLSSFDINTLLTVKFNHPKLETALLFRKDDRVLNVEDKKTFKYKINGIINRSGVKALLVATNTIHPEISLFSTGKKFFWQHNPLLSKMNINTWSVDSNEDFEKAINSGVDIIISDNPKKMVKYRDTLCKTSFIKNEA